MDIEKLKRDLGDKFSNFFNPSSLEEEYEEDENLINIIMHYKYSEFEPDIDKYKSIQKLFKDEFNEYAGFINMPFGESGDLIDVIFSASPKKWKIVFDYIDVYYEKDKFNL